jgi:hypothetical protein
VAEESPFLLGRRENDRWVPVIKLTCPVHNRPLEKEDAEKHEMFGSAWSCPEEGCTIRIFVEVDRERMAQVTRDFSRG